MALPLNKNWIAVLNDPIPEIDPGKSCEQYRAEGMNGVPESPVWWVVDEIAEARRLSFEEAAALFLRQSRDKRGPGLVHHWAQKSDPASRYHAMCRTVALAVLREQNDDEYVTDMHTVDRQVQRLLATSRERWSSDLMINFPDLGLDVSGNALFIDGELTPRVDGFNTLHGRIDEYGRHRDLEFADAAYAILRTALGKDGFAQARHSRDTGQWDETIRYQCRIIAAAFLRDADPDVSGFTLAQVDRAVLTFLITDAELLDMKHAKVRALSYQVNVTYRH